MAQLRRSTRTAVWAILAIGIVIGVLIASFGAFSLGQPKTGGGKSTPPSTPEVPSAPYGGVSDLVNATDNPRVFTDAVPAGISACIVNNESYSPFGGGLMVVSSNGTGTCATGDFGWEFAFNTTAGLVNETIEFFVNDTIVTNGSLSAYMIEASVTIPAFNGTAINMTGCAPIWVWVDYGVYFTNATSLQFPRPTISWI